MVCRLSTAPATPRFEKLNQTGGTSLPGTDPAGPSDNDWEGEEALDIEWAHAHAPMANIILFEATNDSGTRGAISTLPLKPRRTRPAWWPFP